MKRKDVMEELREEAQVPQGLYQLWTVGRFRTIHVTCTRKAVDRLEAATDRLIAKYGGVRYATMSHGVGQLGVAREYNFCFKIGKTIKA